MNSHIEGNRGKERKVFDAFSCYYHIGEIKQIDGEENSYPDGILIQDGQEIAVEQTDYYYYKSGKASSTNQINHSIISKIAKKLKDEGCYGCIGIKLTKNKINRVKLTESIKDYIETDGRSGFDKSLIEKIKYCSNANVNNELVIKDYACDLSSITFCENIPLENAISEIVKKKEDKLNNCSKKYYQHWLIISVPYFENVNIDTREYNPFITFFDKIFIQIDDNEFEEIRTVKYI